MERLFIREKREETAPGHLLGVTGLSRGSGVTAAASSAALFLAEQGLDVRFTECAVPGPGRPLLYEAAAFSERFRGRSFQDVYSLLAEEKPVSAKPNMEMGVSWILASPESREKCADFTESMRGRLIRQGMRAEYAVFDCLSGAEEWFPYMRDFDALLVLVDPLPSRLEAGMPVFRQMKALENEGRVNIFWLVNRMCGSVSRRQLRRFLMGRRIFWLDDLGRDCFCQDEYCCRLHWENKKIREAFRPVLQEMFGELGWALPRE
ncbi:MAG: hypothetical protein ACI4W2_05725 [Eubacterium sp.]